MTDAILTARDLVKVYRSPGGDVTALDGVSLAVHPGELVMVRGRSGSGKTTLLNILGGLDTADAGSVLLDGVDLEEMTEAQRVGARRTRLGFVFQGFGLIPVLSAAENVELPLRIQRAEVARREEAVRDALALVGLAGHAQQRPYELSGGQQQRVGIARALAAGPGILIADEPTGQLDSATAEQMMDLLRGITRERGVAVLVSTHDPLMASRADTVFELHDGRLAAVG